MLGAGYSQLQVVVLFSSSDSRAYVTSNLVVHIVMGHRHLFRASQMFENHDQNWNPVHVEQPYLHLGGTSAFENGSFALPVENADSEIVNPLPHYSAPRSTEHSSSIRMDIPHYRGPTSGPFYDPFMHPSAAGSYCPVPQNYADRPTYHGHIHGVEGGADNSVIINGRGPCKRKSPVASAFCDRGSTSSYYDAGSSSGMSSSYDLHSEKLAPGSQNWAPWDPVGITPNYIENNLSIAEASQRNVRSRSTLDLEMNLARTHLSSNPYFHPHSAGHPIPHSGALDLAGPTTRSWSHPPIISPPGRGRILAASDTNGLSQGMDQFMVGGSSSTSGSADFSGYNNNDLASSRNSVVPLPIPHGPAAHSARGGRIGHAQRTIPGPGYRAVTNYPRMGYAAENGVQLGSDSYSSRHSSIGWRGGERNGRPRVSYDRFRSFSDDAVDRDRLASEGGIMMMDRSSLYGSRNLLDQHREMRLDVDNMSYEELLALGERIGSVNTGLSEDMISRCLRESTYCYTITHEEEHCVICLEEYKSKDDVGTLMNCRHNYHVGCIRKWLLMKNACPICKNPALADTDK